MNVAMLWLGCAVLLYALAAIRSRAAARKSERTYPPAGRFITVDGAPIHYVRAGTGRPVVLLHGSDGFLQDFSNTVMDRLATEYDVIAFDRPGHGFSALPNGECASAPVQARVIHGALTELGIERPIFVGHSWAALLVLYYAWRYPAHVSGTVLLAPWIYPGRFGEAALRAISIPWVASSIYPLFALVKPLIVHGFLRDAFAADPIPPEYQRQAKSLWLRSAGQLAATARENSGNRSALVGFSPSLVPTAVPMLIAVGDLDHVTPVAAQARRLQEDMPHATLTIIAGAGHELMHTRPAAVIRLIQECAEAAVPRHAVAVMPAHGAQVHTVVPTPRDRARDLVFRYGWNATAYQILNPHIDLWFSATEEACVGYSRQAGVRVVAGAPVCAEPRLEAVIAEFEGEAARAGDSVCYFGAAERLTDTLAKLPSHASIAIGAQPIWGPQRWPDILAHHKSLRAQLNRARNKGVVAEEQDSESAAKDVGLQICLNEWTGTHAGFPLHFLTEPVPLDSLADRRLFVARRLGVPVGFLVATPVPDRHGWLAEQIVRGANAPNGTAELLIDALMQTAAREGYRYVTLGVAPLSNHGATPAVRLLWLRLLLAWVRAHGRRFYNFEGLDAFKAKFQPDAWEPIYAISNERSFSARSLYAIAAAFTEGSPLITIGAALFAALRQELRWLQKPPRPSGRQA